MMGWRAHHHGLIIIATTLVNKPMRRSPGALTGSARCISASSRPASLCSSLLHWQPSISLFWSPWSFSAWTPRRESPAPSTLFAPSYRKHSRSRQRSRALTLFEKCLRLGCEWAGIARDGTANASVLDQWWTTSAPAMRGNLVRIASLLDGNRVSHDAAKAVTLQVSFSGIHLRITPRIVRPYASTRLEESCVISIAISI